MTFSEQFDVVRRAAEAGRFDRLVMLYRESEDYSVFEGLVVDEILERAADLLGELPADEVGVAVCVLTSGDPDSEPARTYISEALARSRRHQEKRPLR